MMGLANVEEIARYEKRKMDRVGFLIEILNNFLQVDKIVDLEIKVLLSNQVLQPAVCFRDQGLVTWVELHTQALSSSVGQASTLAGAPT